jgi:penicillin-binding protein 1A
MAAESTLRDWDEALAPYRPIAGLVPGLVTEADSELALVYLHNGQTVALGLEDVAWARPFISRDRVGQAPTAVNEVVRTGDIIRVRLHDDGRWRLGQLPEVEAALIALDPRDGALRAVVGGYDFRRSKFNRVTQSRRQPGSSFKPYLYSAALANGFTTASLINDAPIVFEDPELERTWKPQNFSERFFGPTRLREAMVHSRNLVSIRLLRSLGVNTAREHISAFGFEPSALPANLSMALGSADLQPLSLARGYAAFANGGYLIEPYFIASVDPEPQRPEFRPLQIEAEGGMVASLERSESERSEDLASSGEVEVAPRIISEQNAFLVRSMMMDVIERGTGSRAKDLGRSDLAGKTGTTNEQRDAWFSGFNEQIVTTVWVGFDNHEPLGRYEVGGRAALPIWVDFMRVALVGVEDRPPVMPEGLASARIDPETGLLATLENPDAIVELFEAGNLPRMETEASGADPYAAAEEDPYDIY